MNIKWKIFLLPHFDETKSRGYSRFLCVTSSFAKGCWSPISKQMEKSGIESHSLMHPRFSPYIFL